MKPEEHKNGESEKKKKKHSGVEVGIVRKWDVKRGDEEASTRAQRRERD